MIRVPSGRDPCLRGKVVLHVKQTIIIYKHNTPKDYNNFVLCIYIYISLLGLSLIIRKRLTSDCLMHTKSKGIK